MIYTAGFDVLSDEGREYAERLETAGVPATCHCFESLSHSFTAMGAVPACRRAQEEIARELARALPRNA